MPHYKNGRRAKVGDKVFGKNEYGAVYCGTVLSIYEKSDSCNLIVVPPGVVTLSVTAKEVLNIEDVSMDCETATDPDPA